MNPTNRILIVENDPASEVVLRQLVRSLDHGAEVDVADTGEVAALKLVEKNGRGEPYDLVIADIFLSGNLTGIDLWRFYREFLPAPPVVLTSALPPPLFLERLRDESAIPPFLPKPYYVEECREILGRYLTSGPKRPPPARMYIPEAPRGGPGSARERG